MKTLLTFFIFSLSSNLLAESYKIAGKEFEFYPTKSKIKISKCKDDCQANEAIKKIIKNKKKYPKTIQKRTFANAIGSSVCQEKLEGLSVLGLAKNKDQRAFCVFKDGSMLEINSISEYLKD